MAVSLHAFPQPPPVTEEINAYDTLANHPVHLVSPLDTSVVIISGSTRVFYQSEDGKTRKKLFKFIRDNLFIDIRERSKRNKQIVDESELLKRFNGKTINSIAYDRNDVFEDKSNWFRSLANGMHMRTVESAIGRDLLFAAGDTFDSEVAVSSNQIIQNRPYISDSWLEVRLYPDDTTRVDVTINTVDNWTIGVDGEILSDKRTMFYLYDVNFLGMGNRAGIKTYLRYGDWRYGGNIIDYYNPNFMGTFYTANLQIGHNFENTYTNAALSKDFILPNDYEAGVSYNDDKYDRFKVFAPDTLGHYKVNYRAVDIWGGRSRFIPSLNSSFYLTAHYSAKRFPVRPVTTAAEMHPAFHDYDEVLFGTGFYWERFYSSTMIYGYGFQEYIAAGQKIQFVGGYSWQEFGNYWYAGITGQKGGFSSIGYILGGMSIGSYIDARDGSLWQSALNLRTQWFSNLWNVGRSKIRQFITVRYTQGWNRGEGAGSLVRFWDEVHPTSFDAYAAGSSRLLVNTETVLFTPLQPLGFRIALFGFADAGWIGCNNSAFHNDFFSTFGIGIRFKNERLVFSAFQLRLGFAVGKNGLLNNKMFSGSVEQRMNQHRFIPSRPESVLYE